MNDIRLVAADVDGTILPHGGTISDATRRAVAACVARGIPFVIASGRWAGALEDIVRDIGAAHQPLIIANGGAVLSPEGEIWHEWFMRDEDVRATYDVLRRHNVMINSYIPGAVYRLNTAAVGPSYVIREYTGAKDYRTVNDDRAAFERNALTNVYKLEAITEDRALIARVRAELAERGVVVTGAFWRNTEIQSPGMGKGTALRWLADKLGIPRECCMAFGDNTNDLDMLRAAGWPVAMANGAEAAKAVARIIAPPDVEDGVAKVIFKEVLEAAP